jgi:hypothetical protein
MTNTEESRRLRACRREQGLCILCANPNHDMSHGACRPCRIRLSNVAHRRHHERKLWLMFAAGIGAALSPLPLNRGDGT